MLLRSEAEASQELAGVPAPPHSQLQTPGVKEAHGLLRKCLGFLFTLHSHPNPSMGVSGAP